MADKAWKAFERKAAKFFGSVRNSLSGGNSKQSRSDSLHEKLFIECKQRVKFSSITLWRDTKAKADKENKIPVICLSEKNKKGFWIIVHSDNYKEVSRYIAEK